MHRAIKEVFTPKEIARRIKKAQNDAIRQLRNGEEGAAKGIINLLKSLDRDLRFELSNIPTGQFKAFHLRRMLSIIDVAMANFNANAQRLIGKSSEASIALGQQFFMDQFDALLKIEGFSTSIPPVISNELVTVTKTMSTELIKGLSSDISKKVKTTLQRAVLGNKTPFEASKEIRDIIGPRGTSTSDADRIVRTEVNRAFNTTDEFMSKAAEKATPLGTPELMKIWVTANDSRVRGKHAKAHKQVKKVSKPFRVGGEDLMHPLDPTGSPGNTINCRCTRFTVPADLIDDFLSTIPG